MPLWTNVDQAAGAPKHTIEAGSTANGSAMYGNVTPDAFKEDKAIGVFGVDTTEARLNKKVTHPGWVKVVQGTGGVAQLLVADGGEGYGNGSVGHIQAPSWGVNAAYSVVTDANGTVTALNLINDGGGWKNSVANVVLAENGVYAVTIDDGGEDYLAGDTVRISNAAVNAVFMVSTVDANGTITALTQVSGGRGFSTDPEDAVVAVTTANGTGANLIPVVADSDGNLEITVVMGGRVGRVHMETLVAMSTITGDGSDDAIFPDA